MTAYLGYRSLHNAGIPALAPMCLQINLPTPCIFMASEFARSPQKMRFATGAQSRDGFGGRIFPRFLELLESCALLGSSRQKRMISHCLQVVGEVLKGDAEFAQNTHCIVRFTQLFCSQCKYGQPHSSLALLPQHTSRRVG